MRSGTYYEYIDGPEWAAKRQARMDLDGHECKGCHSKEDLQVHHATYVRFGGRELMSDLVTVCGRCHRLIHKTYRPTSGPRLAAVTFRVLKQMQPRENTEFKRTELPLVMPRKDGRGNWLT